jgi:hypothetical protein
MPPRSEAVCLATGNRDLGPHGTKAPLLPLPSRRAPFLGFAAPAQAPSIDRVPSGKQWIHEIKFDGYRVQSDFANAAAKVFTRRGRTGRTGRSPAAKPGLALLQFGDCQCSHTRSAPLKTIGDGSSFPPASLSQGLRPKRSRAITVVNILGTGDVVAAAGALAGHALLRTP